MNRRHVGIGVAVVATGLALAGMLWAGPEERVAPARGKADWPNWRGPAHNGISAETGWKTQWTEPPGILWRASVGTGFSSFSVAGGRAYTMGNAGDQDTVWCFDAASGEVLWKHTYPCPLLANNYEGGTHATPTIDGDRLYTLSKTGMAFCLAAADGRVVWAKDLRKDLGLSLPQWGFAGSALVLGKLVVLNVGTAGAALDKNTGQVVWKTGPGASGYATPVLLPDGKSLAVFGAQALYGVNAQNGNVLWSFPWKTSYDVNAADPIPVDDKRLFISSGYNHGCALVDVSTGQPRGVWESRDMRNHFNSCVLIDGHLYGFDENQLRCLSAADGQVKWTQRGLGKGSLMSADGKLIIFSESGKLVIANASPEKYEEQASVQVLSGRCWTTPVLSDGRVFVRNARGDAACVGLSAERP